MKNKLLMFLSLSLFISGINGTNTYAATEWTMKTPGVYQMLDGSSINGVYARGVDTSHWQGDVDWKAAAADDVKFLMHGTRYKGKQDPKFVYNMNAAHKEGIALGVYIYSYAMTPAEAEAEAEAQKRAARSRSATAHEQPTRRHRSGVIGSDGVIRAGHARRDCAGRSSARTPARAGSRRSNGRDRSTPGRPPRGRRSGRAPRADAWRPPAAGTGG